MRTIAPAVTRAAAVAAAAAAVGVLAFTALVDAQGGGRPARTPKARPVSPVPVSTLPGMAVPTDSAGPSVGAKQARTWLGALAGTWTRDGRNTYFSFHPDGTGTWVSFGQNLWSGKAVPRDATTFDLSDTDGHGGGYWQVALLGGGRLRFAGTGQIFGKA